MYRHKGSAPFNCTRCGKRFFQKSNLKVHLRSSHYDFKLYKCPFCGKSFPTAQGLKAHAYIHQFNSLPCPNCDEVLANKKLLDKHVREKHADELEKPFKCAICDKSYEIPRYLEHHMEIHKGFKRFNCTECERTFLFRMHLRRHQLYTHGKVGDDMNNATESLHAGAIAAYNSTNSTMTAAELLAPREANRKKNSLSSSLANDMLSSTAQSSSTLDLLGTHPPPQPSIQTSLQAEIKAVVQRTKNYVQDNAVISDPDRIKRSDLATKTAEKIKQMYQETLQIGTIPITYVNDGRTTTVKWERRKRGRPMKMDVVDLAEAATKGEIGGNLRLGTLMSRVISTNNGC